MAKREAYIRISGRFIPLEEALSHGMVKNSEGQWERMTEENIKEVIRYFDNLTPTPKESSRGT